MGFNSAFKGLMAEYTWKFHLRG